MADPIFVADFSSVEGIEELKAALRQGRRDVLDSLEKRMTENVEDLLGESEKRVPVKEGTLAGSGTARVNRSRVARTIRGDGTVLPPPEHVGEAGEALIDEYGAVIIGQVGYGVIYAHRQHEGDYNHIHGERKYLENPLKERMATKYFPNLIEGVREVLGS